MKTFVSFIVPILLIFSLLFVCLGYYALGKYSEPQVSQDVSEEKDSSDASEGDTSSEEMVKRKFLLSNSDFDIVTLPKYGVGGYCEGWLIGFSTSELKPNTTYVITVNTVEIEEFCIKSTPCLLYSSVGLASNLRYSYSIFLDNSYTEGNFPSSVEFEWEEDFPRTLRLFQSGEEGKTFVFFFPFISSHMADNEEEAVSFFEEYLLPKIFEISIEESRLILR